MTPPKPVVFFHVMKCGGTSIRAGLIDALAGGEPSEFFELDGRASVHATGWMAGRDDLWRFRDALLLYVLEAMQPSLVVGHFRFHERHARLLDSAHLVTVLRNPVERLISLYEYRRFGGASLRPTSLTFEDYLATEEAEMEGRRYVETFYGGARHDATSAEAVDRAIQHLRQFAAVGFLGDIDDFTVRLGALTGTSVGVPFLNRSAAPTGHRDHLPETTVERLQEICRPDLRVFHALESAPSPLGS
jgi:hypothetical protein